jgi:hypothetical protein
MKPDRVNLSTATNGFAWLTTASLARYLWLAFLLRARHGFRREGRLVIGPGDDAAFRDFVRGALRLLAGHDDIFGYQVLATDAAADEFIRRQLAGGAEEA